MVTKKIRRSFKYLMIEILDKNQFCLQILKFDSTCRMPMLNFSVIKI